MRIYVKFIYYASFMLFIFSYYILSFPVILDIINTNPIIASVSVMPIVLLVFRSYQM